MLWGGRDFDGYGFNLHSDKNRVGQFIGKVDEGSPAEAAGLKRVSNLQSQPHRHPAQPISTPSNPIKTHQSPSKPIETYRNPSKPIKTHQNPSKTTINSKTVSVLRDFSWKKSPEIFIWLPGINSVKYPEKMEVQTKNLSKFFEPPSEFHASTRIKSQTKRRVFFVKRKKCKINKCETTTGAHSDLARATAPGGRQRRTPGSWHECGVSGLPERSANPRGSPVLASSLHHVFPSWGKPSEVSHHQLQWQSARRPRVSVLCAH